MNKDETDLEIHKKSMIGLKKNDNLLKVIETIEKEKHLLIKELETRNKFIGKVKAYMGSVNFNEFLRLI